MAGENHRIRFMANNHSETITATVSSEDATNLSANIQNTRRSSYWTSTGYFNATATNNLLYINDGSNFTATIPVLEYTTRDLLATAIQTALNAVSSSWTCVHDSATGFFTIDRTAGTKILRLTQTTNAAWDLMGYTGASDITAGIADAKRWHEEEHLVWDLGVAVDCSFFAAIYKAGKDFELSSTGTYTIQGNNVNDFSAPPLDETMTVSASGLFHFMTTATTTYRYWKFIYVNNQNTDSDFPISHIYLGDYKTMSTTNITSGFSKSLVDPSKKVTSIGGQEYYALKTKYFKFSNMSINHLTETERLEIEDIFYSQGVSEPFYISLDPTLCLTSGLADLTKLVRFDTSPVFRQLFLSRFNVGFSVHEVI